jgi:chorismate mutase / prephenate dehydratase
VTSKRMEQCRAEIDSIDAELLRLLERRAEVASEIGALKRRAGLPICDPGREREVLRRVRQRNPGALDDLGVMRIFRSIMRESRRLQQRLPTALSPLESAMLRRNAS